MSELVQAVRMFQGEWSAARAAWERADPALYAATPPEPIDRFMEVMTSPFGALVRAIGHQQVSIYAGRAIVSRLVDASQGLDPAAVLQLSDDELRAVGLSWQKVKYVRALAEAAVAGELDGLEAATEAEVTERLVRLPGIGVWSAKMFCIFYLERPDVFSGDDLGLREGIRILDQMTEPISAAAAEARAEIWSPFRSVAAVSLWDLVRRTRLDGKLQK